jgi:hypothetical protein
VRVTPSGGRQLSGLQRECDQQVGEGRATSGDHVVEFDDHKLLPTSLTLDSRHGLTSLDDPLTFAWARDDTHGNGC